MGEASQVATTLIPVDPTFSHPINKDDPQHMNVTPDPNLPDGENVENRKIRHYTVNFGPQHPAAHGKSWQSEAITKLTRFQVCSD